MSKCSWSSELRGYRVQSVCVVHVSAERCNCRKSQAESQQKWENAKNRKIIYPCLLNESNAEKVGLSTKDSLKENSAHHSETSVSSGTLLSFAYQFPLFILLPAPRAESSVSSLTMSRATSIDVKRVVGGLCCYQLPFKSQRGFLVNFGLELSHDPTFSLLFFPLSHSLYRLFLSWNDCCIFAGNWVQSLHYGMFRSWDILFS